MEVSGHHIVPQEARQGLSFNVFATCRQCWQPIGVRAKVRNNDFRSYDDYEGWVETICDLTDNVSISSLNLDISIVHAPERSSSIPEHLPAAAAKAFRAAEATFMNPDAAEVSAMAYRRSVEMALKEKRADLKGPLRSRIDKLRDDGTIPAILQDWAHEVRMIGNDGAHEVDDLRHGDLEAIRGFASAFLRYFISFPTELTMRRQAISEGAKSED